MLNLKKSHVENTEMFFKKRCHILVSDMYTRGVQIQVKQRWKRIISRPTRR